MMTIWGTLSILGGFSSVLMAAFCTISTIVNRQMQYEKYIRTFFFAKDKQGK